MANLIITVISIALVAVAAVMGAYYGGSAFMQGKAKAEANRLVAAGEQIAAATTLWSSTTGRFDYEDGNFNFLLTQNYLSSIPKSSSGNQARCVWPSNSAYGGYIDCGTGTASTSSDEKAFVFISIENADDNTAPPTTCTQISKLAGGPTATPRTDYIPKPVNGRKFDCIYETNEWLLAYSLN